MLDVGTALGAVQRPPPSPVAPSRRSAVLVGGGGVLGAAVLERLLGSGRFAPVRVLVSQPLRGTVRALQALPADTLNATAATEPIAEAAVVVFDRARRANGREEAFVRADPAELVALAARLRQRGVVDLVVVLPHAPALLPEALKRGLANLDEQAVAALGFRHLVFVRSAGAVTSAPDGSRLQRLAHALLRQLMLMLPAAQQPVQVPKVAAFVAELLAQLPEAQPGTRVVPPELVWFASREADAAGVVADWLAGRPLPPLHAPRMRL